MLYIYMYIAFTIVSITRSGIHVMVVAVAVLSFAWKSPSSRRNRRHQNAFSHAAA